MPLRQALGWLAERLPRPIALQHVLRPLLLRLPGSPDVALALTAVGAALGPAAAARHLLPPLLAVVACWAPIAEAAGSAGGGRSSDGKDGAAQLAV